MTELLEKRSIQLSLGCIVILIWGYNMVQLTDVAPWEDAPIHQEAVGTGAGTMTVPDRDTYTYDDGFRDPFKSSLVPKPPETDPKPSPKTAAPVRLPKLTLTGVIEGMAIIQTDRLETLFALPGDTVSGGVVQHVSPDSVVMKFQSRTLTLKLKS